MTTTTSLCSFCQASNPTSSQFCLKCGEPLLVGRCAGSYRLLSPLGSGGMGIVFRAEHVRLGTPFAVKLLHQKMAKHEKIAARFLLEAKATSTLRHEHIVFLADFGDMESFGPYLAMEYLEGQPLSKAQQQSDGLSLRDIILIGTQVCEAMQYSHQQGMIHRDLKPDNIFMLRRDEGQAPFLKILDFGIAKIMQEESENLTKTGAVLGTPSYMAPEQGLGQDIDPRVDIYALCTILFQLCAGRTPFVGESVVEILSQRMYHEAPLLSTFAPALRGTKLEQLIAKGLQRDKGLRFLSMKELRESLLQAEHELVQHTSPALHTQPLQTLLRSVQTPPHNALGSRQHTVDPHPSVPPPPSSVKATALPSVPSVARSNGEFQDMNLPTPHSQDAISAYDKALVATIPPPSSPLPQNISGAEDKPTTLLLSSSESLAALGLGISTKMWLFSGSLVLLGLTCLGLWQTGYFSKTHNTTPPPSPPRQTHQTSLSTTHPKQPSAKLPTDTPPDTDHSRQSPDASQPSQPRVEQVEPPTIPIETRKRPVSRRKYRKPRIFETRPSPTNRVQDPPQLRTAIPPRPAPPRQVQDGCPTDHNDTRWIRLRGSPPQVEIRIAGRLIPYKPKAKGWCIAYQGRPLSIQIDGTTQNLALCEFKLHRFSQRTLTISLKDAEDQSPGAYCVKGLP